MTEHSDNSEAESIGRRAVLAAVAGAAGLAGAGSAAGQESPTPPSTSSTATETENESVVVDLGPLRIKSWEFTDGEFLIDFGADYPSALKITDTGAVMSAMTTGSGGGVSEIPTRGLTVKDGMTVTFQPEKFDDAHAITVASSDGAALIRTDSVETGSPTVEMGTAAAGVGAAAVGSGWYSFKKGREKMEEDEGKQIDRIA